jgi:hypothetical protein
LEKILNAQNFAFYPHCGPSLTNCASEIVNEEIEAKSSSESSDDDFSIFEDEFHQVILE